jgi:heat shock protein 90kDa beta
MHNYAKKQKVLEINPYSPLIKGLLRRVKQMNSDDEGRPEAEQVLKEVTSILIDGALVRSGFDTPDADLYVVLYLMTCL